MADKPKGATPKDYEPPNPEPKSAWGKAVAGTGTILITAAAAIFSFQNDEPNDHSQVVHTGIENDTGHELVLGVDEGSEVTAYFVDPEAGQECTIDNVNCFDLASRVSKVNAEVGRQGYPSRDVYTERAQHAISQATEYAYNNYNKPTADDNPYAEEANEAMEVLKDVWLLEAIDAFSCSGEIPQNVAVQLKQMVAETPSTCNFAQQNKP